MALTRDDVQRLADLARIQLTDVEQDMAEQELDAVLGFVNRLQQVDTTNVEPQTMPARTEWRPDEARECDDVTREFVLANFPSRLNDLLHVPPVFENPKG